MPNKDVCLDPNNYWKINLFAKKSTFLITTKDSMFFKEFIFSIMNFIVLLICTYVQLVWEKFIEIINISLFNMW